jgi:hypothetical protein
VFDVEVETESVLLAVELVDVDAGVVEFVVNDSVFVEDVDIAGVVEDVDTVELVGVDEEVRLELSIGKIATAFAVDQPEIKTIKATMAIRAPTVTHVVVDVNACFLTRLP